MLWLLSLGQWLNQQQVIAIGIFDFKANCTVLVERYLLQELAEDTYQIHDRIRELLRQKLEDLAEADELKRGYCQVMVAVAEDIPQTPTLIEIAQATKLWR